MVSTLAHNGRIATDNLDTRPGGRQCAGAFDTVNRLDDAAEKAAESVTKTSERAYHAIEDMDEGASGE